MLDHAALSGNPKDGTYSQALASGNFFIVLSLSGEQGDVNLELGRNVLTKIEEIISQTPEISPKEIIEMQKEELSDGINLGIVIAKIENQQLYLAGTGDVEAKLVRKDKIIRLNASLVAISGTLLHNDLLILDTASFSSTIPPLTLVSNSHLPVSQIRDLLLPQIETMPDNSHLAALLIKIELQDYPDKTEVPVPASPVHKTSPLSHLHNLYLRHPRDPNAPTSPRRKILYLALIILVSLISLIVFQLRSRVLEQREETIQNMERQVRDGLSSAEKLSGLNDQIARDVLLQTRRDFMEKAEQTFGQNWQVDKSAQTQKLQRLMASLDKEISQLSRSYNLSNLDLFYDFSLLKSGVKISSAWAHKGETVVLDTNNGAIYSLNLTTKGAAIVTGSDDLKKGRFVDFSAEKIYVWSPDGIYFIDRSSSIVSPSNTKIILKSSPKWGTVKDLKVFVENIYLLDSQNNQVWKYQNTDLGFTDLTNYLQKGLPLDFSNVLAMAIDGSVNVLTSTGNIAKFSGGSPEPFKIPALPADSAFVAPPAKEAALAKGGLKDPVSFFVTDETNNIYILDSDGKRIVVLSKNGNYVAQYLLPSTMDNEPGSTMNLVVDESLKKVFLISGSKVFSFELK